MYGYLRRVEITDHGLRESDGNVKDSRVHGVVFEEGNRPVGCSRG
jgi:hypothetical protein